MALAHRRRRVWSTDHRAHLELRAVESARQQEYLDAIRSRLGDLTGVESIAPLPGPGRVVVSFDPSTITLEGVRQAQDAGVGESWRRSGKHTVDRIVRR